MIVNYWPAWFRELYGGTWPRSYCAIDVETTGYAPSQDVVTEWGHCLVEDGEVVDRLGLVIDWTDRSTPPEHWLVERLRQVSQSMELKGNVCHMSVERMRAEGMKPEKAFAFIRDFVATVRAKNIPLVAHNGFFDERMLSGTILQFGFGPGFSLGDMYLDTSAIEKASQAIDNRRVHPQFNDTLRSYMQRVSHTRLTGIKSNMTEHCFVRYNFAKKYGITPDSLHGAETDSYCCHLLMEEFRLQLSADIAPPPFYPTEDDTRRRTASPKPATAAVTGKRYRKQRNN